jgi:hypothetical protein
MRAHQTLQGKKKEMGKKQQREWRMTRATQPQPNPQPNPQPRPRPYRFRTVATCDHPWLPSVECAVVLTMRGSDRWKAHLPFLSRLCRRTVLQINDGFRAGGKPEWVRATNSDLVHAYVHACESTRHLGSVLLLEDDAEPMPGASFADFAEVDAFLRGGDERWDAYTLGSMGRRHATRSRHHFRMRTGLHGEVACTQAVVWSHAARQRLLRTSGASIPHIDCHFLSVLARVYVFCRPLVVQRFPPTDNRQSWCVVCRDEVSARARDRFAIGMFALVLAGLRMDRALGGWNVVYAYHMLAPLHVAAILGTHARDRMEVSCTSHAVATSALQLSAVTTSA